jgi:uncharacterized protein (DUF305 family)
MAAHVLRSQSAEIDSMHNWRQAWFGSSQTPPMERMPMLGHQGDARGHRALCVPKRSAADSREQRVDVLADELGLT